jgi:hypothetical protein
MRATIVVDDNVVLIDGEAETVDCSALVAENVHAVQWYGTWGEVEHRTVINDEAKAFSRQPNEVIDDLSPYQQYLDAWQVEKNSPPDPPPPPPKYVPPPELLDLYNKILKLEGKNPVTSDEYAEIVKELNQPQG